MQVSKGLDFGRSGGTGLPETALRQKSSGMRSCGRSRKLLWIGLQVGFSSRQANLAAKWWSE